MKKFILGAVLILSISLYGQGCSDAGFCTISNFQANLSDTISRNNSIRIGSNIGFADNDVIVFGSYLQYNRMLSSSVDFDVKVNYTNQSANGISSSALSDVFLSSNFKLAKTFKVTTGVKVPLTDGNLTYNGQFLPMDYQPSLGTLDLIIGASKKIDKWNFALALQQPLTQNDNKFIAPNGSNFFSTNKFVRAGDLLFRTSYLFVLTERLTLSPSVLPIYHLAEDKYTDSNGVQKNIENSNGLTVNLNSYLNYRLNDASGLEFSIGLPTIVRESRPDGLTRGLVANLEYKIKF